MEDREEQIAKQIAEIQKLAATNKNIDSTALIQQLLSSTKQPELPPKDRTRAYMVSLLLPPFGLYYVVKFFMIGDPPAGGARRAAWTCVILTVISVGMTVWFGSAMFSQTANVGGLQGVSPQDLNDLLGE